MSEPTRAQEPLEHRAAGWLNGFMYYGLVGLATLAGLWFLVDALLEANAIVETLPAAQQQVFHRVLLALGLVMTGVTAALNWRGRKQAAPKA